MEVFKESISIERHPWLSNPRFLQLASPSRHSRSTTPEHTLSAPTTPAYPPWLLRSSALFLIDILILRTAGSKWESPPQKKGRNAIPGSLAKASIHLTLQGFRFSHPPSKFRSFDAASHSIFIRDGDEFHGAARGLSDGLQIMYDAV